MLVRLPSIIAHVIRAQVNIFHVGIVVSNIDYLARIRGIRFIGGAFWVRAGNRVHSGESWVQLGILVDNMCESVLSLFYLRLGHTNVGRIGQIRLVVTVPTIMN